MGGCFLLSWKVNFLLYKCHDELYNKISNNRHLTWVFFSGIACAWECFWCICVLRKYVTWRKLQNTFHHIKKISFQRNTQTVTLSSYRFFTYCKTISSNCVLSCANLPVITLCQSWYNALQHEHCRYMPHTRVMPIQQGDNGGVGGNRQFLMCFPNLTWIKQPFMHFDASCPSPNLQTKLQK